MENQQTIGLLDQQNLREGDEEEQNLVETTTRSFHASTTHNRGGWRKWIDRINICWVLFLLALIALLAMACLYCLYWAITMDNLLIATEQAATASEVHAPYHSDLLYPIVHSNSGRLTLPPDGAPCIIKGEKAYCSTGHEEKYKGECPYWQWYMTTSGWVLLPERSTDNCPNN